MRDATRLKELLLACARHDPQAFERLYRLTSGQLFAIALRIVRQRDLAEDILQQAFIKIWRGAHRYNENQGQPISWMITIVRNQAIDCLRRLRPAIPFDDNAAAQELAALPAGEPGGNPYGEALWACVMGLNEQQRQSVLLAYYHGYTHAELAQRLGAPLGTVKSWIRRGLTQLRRCLDP